MKELRKLEEFNQGLENINKNIRESKTKIVKLEKEIQKQVREQEKAVLSGKKINGKSIDRLKAELTEVKSDKKKYKAMYQSELLEELGKRALDEYQDNIEPMIKDIRSKHKREYKDLEEAYNKKLEELEIKHNDEIGELKNKYISPYLVPAEYVKDRKYKVTRVRMKNKLELL